MERLDRTKTIAYSIGNLAAGMYYAFNNFTLPLYLRFFTNNNILIGWLSSTRSFEQAIVQPFVGAWSDRTWTRLGRRAPFFLGGMGLSAVFLIANAFIPHQGVANSEEMKFACSTIPAQLPTLPHQDAWRLIVVLTIFLFSFFFNVGIDPYTALLADVTPSEHRGTVNGIKEIFGFVGQVGLLTAAFLILNSHTDWMFYIVAVGLVVGFGVVALLVREPRTLSRDGMTSQGNAEPLVKPSLAPYVQYLRDRWSEQREAVKLLGVKFLYQFGVNAAVPFLTLFIVEEIGTTGWCEMMSSIPALANMGLCNAGAKDLSQLVAAALLFWIAIFTVPCGMVGDRFGKKRVFMLGLVVTGISALFAAFATSIPQLLLYEIFLGFGLSAQTVLFFPYLSDLIPPERVGEFQGLSAAADTGGVFLSILLAGALLNWNPLNLCYRLIFIITGIFLLLAVFAVMFVKARMDAGTETHLEEVAQS